MEKAAIRAGNSEKSSLMKLGISGTLKLKNMRTVDTAESMPVMAMVRVGIRWVFMASPLEIWL